MVKSLPITVPGRLEVKINAQLLIQIARAIIRPLETLTWNEDTAQLVNEIPTQIFNEPWKVQCVA